LLVAPALLSSSFIATSFVPPLAVMNRRRGLKTFLRVGLPFMLMSLYGTYILSRLVQAKYEHQKQRVLSSLSTSKDLSLSKNFNLEEELKVSSFPHFSINMNGHNIIFFPILFLFRKLNKKLI
jgi:hypothetical protein